jgi:hypothetical protein
MSDVIAGVRQLIQDLIAPDVKAIAANQNGLLAGGIRAGIRA